MGNHISLSSDSRISFGAAGYIDYGIKVFSVPVKIHSPTSVETDATDLVYSNKLGLAITGSAINAYTVKESVYEMLQHLQYVPGHTDVSLDGIASLIFKVFRKSTMDLGGIMRENGISELIVSGFCPGQRKLRVFYFFCDIFNNPIQPGYEEILVDSGMRFFGSGKVEAQRVFNATPQLSPLHIVRQVIRDARVPTVGGGMQYGEFAGNNFEVFGIEDYMLNPDGSFKEYLYTLRGLNLYREEFEADSGDFHVAYKFKQPFEREINETWQRDDT